MKDRDAGKDIGCQLMLPRIEQIILGQQVPFADDRFEIEVPCPVIGFRRGKGCSPESIAFACHPTRTILNSLCLS